MAKKSREGVILIGNFNASGLSYSRYSGNKDSFYKLCGLDLHSEPGILKAAQRLVRETTPPTEFIKCQVASTNGRTYHFSADTGKIWEETGGTYTLVLTTTATAGEVKCLGAYEYQGFIYWATQSRLHRILATDAEGATEWGTNKALNWAELNLDQATIGGTGATAYSLTNAVNEGATHKQTFIPEGTLIEGVRVKCVATGTAVDWTVVLHDSANTVIGTKTVASAGIAAGLIYFTFATPLTVTPGSTYHLHLYASATTGTPTADTVVNNDFEGAQVSIFSPSDDDFHPMIEQNLVLYIGDGHFLHQVDAGTFTNKALDISPPLRIKSLGKISTDVLLGTYIDDNVNKTQIIRWNTWSVSFTNSDEIDEVGINAFLPMDNFTLVSAGVAGNIYLYDGVKLELYRKVPGSYSSTATATINPNAVGSINGNVLFGMSNITGNPVDQGVYQVARHSRDFKYVMDLPYPLSLRSGSDFVLTGIEIGSILVKGQNVYVAWKRSTTVTISIATPGVVTYTAHGLSNGDAIVFTTTGALPTGLTSGTVYFARSTGTNTLNIYDTAAYAVAGGATGRVDTTGTQPGVHTAATVGIDKIDALNKLSGAYIETRVMTVEREKEENIANIIVAYASLPASTAVGISYDKNYTGSYTAATTTTDTSRKIIDADGEGLTCNVLQLKFTLTTNSNDSPILDSAGVFLR